MDESLADRFEQDRARLQQVAFRILGSRADADDAVQETWLRLSRSDPSAIDNLGGWLTTVVARICLDVLRARTTRRDDPWDEFDAADARPEADPEQAALLADSVGPALLIVLDALAPAERLAFVLHDLFAMPFDDIATIIGRSPAATRQLASRARRRVHGAQADGAPDLSRQREIVAAFLAASREGDFVRLLALLDPDVVLRADPAAVVSGALAEVRGADRVADTFAGRARAARLALVDGQPAAAWMHGGALRVVFTFAVNDGQICEIGLLADPDRLTAMDVVFV